MRRPRPVMTVEELIARLQAVKHRSAPVYFDAEAARFHTHLVNIVSCEETGTDGDGVAYEDARCVLYTDDPREH
jgi:hypothetical protein